MKRGTGGGFLLVVFLTTTAAVVPASWLTWTRDVADVVRAPIMPVSRAGTAVASWLRPPRDEIGRPVKEAEIDQLRRDRDHFEQLWEAQRVRADDMARRLRQLEGLPEDAYRSVHPPLVVDAQVTGRDPSDPRSPIELRAPQSGGDRLAVGDIAIWNGQQLVGRLSHVSPVRLLVLPLSNPESGPIEVMLASDEAGDPVRRLLLRQHGAGVLTADIDRRTPVEPGARLLLADSRWPAWSHGLEVAVVERLEAIDAAPLRQRLVARPAVDVPAVSQVSILTAVEEISP